MTGIQLPQEYLQISPQKVLVFILIDLGRIKGWANNVVTQLFWTWDRRIVNSEP